MEIHFVARLRMVDQIRVVTAMPAAQDVRARTLRLSPDRHDDSRDARRRQPGCYAFEQRTIDALTAWDRIATETDHEGVSRKRNEQE